MIALLVAPRLGTTGAGMELRAAAEGMRADIRRLRNAALSQSRETVILFDTAAGTWADGAGRSLGQMPDGAHLAAVVARPEQLREDLGGVRFYPDGTSTGGTVTLSHGEDRIELSIDWFDGHVAVARSEG